LFHLGDKGTVFLDEIGEMSLRMQAMLLRFLENGEIKPVGSDVISSKVDVRIVAATNRNLPDMVARGLFREDLLYRIMVVHLEVPPLRDRREDIRPLIAHISAHHNGQLSIDEEALAAMERYNWPGNIRELQNVVEQIAWLGSGTTVGVKDLPPTLLAAANGSMRLGRERRRRLADQLYEALTTRSCSFWEHVYPMFISRDLTRADLTALVAKALAATAGNYRAVLPLLGMEPGDYKRFLNLLSTHGCTVDFREFRGKRPQPDDQRERAASLPATVPTFSSSSPDARVASGVR
jgi:DNA-binding NtrC family response regulator